MLLNTFFTSISLLLSLSVVRAAATSPELPGSEIILEGGVWAVNIDCETKPPILKQICQAMDWARLPRNWIIAKSSIKVIGITEYYSVPFPSSYYSEVKFRLQNCVRDCHYVAYLRRDVDVPGFRPKCRFWLRGKNQLCKYTNHIMEPTG